MENKLVRIWREVQLPLLKQLISIGLAQTRPSDLGKHE